MSQTEGSAVSGEEKVDFLQLVAEKTDEVLFLIDAAATQCGYTSSVSCADSFSSRRSLFIYNPLPRFLRVAGASWEI